MGMGIRRKIKRALQLVGVGKRVPNIQPYYVTKLQTNLLEGKVALITGGTGGIGLAIAKAFLEAGAKVIITGTTEQKVCDALSKLGVDDRAKGVALDIRNVAAFPAVIEQAAALFEENRIDILVNSAGVHGDETLGNLTEDGYDSVLDVNLKGVVFMTQAMGNYMKNAAIKGHILNVSSAASIKPAWTPYEISKWGLRGFTLGAADELLRYGIVVNAIAPGPVATAMLGQTEGNSLYTDCVPSQRFADPMEIGQLATIMVSDMCNLVIGDSFFITGGSGTIKFR